MTLENIAGLGKRQNDVLFSMMNSDSSEQQDKVLGNITSTKNRHVVFFPGDVQVCIYVKITKSH